MEEWQFSAIMVKSWCSTQAIVALSSGEAEYYGIVKGASISMGLRSMMRDLGLEATLRINTDASSRHCAQEGAREG